MKQHLLETKALPDVCDANGTHPAMFYRWLKELPSNAAHVFGKGKEKVRWFTVNCCNICNHAVYEKK